MKVSDVMKTKLITLNPNQTIQEAAKKMIDYRISILPVVDGNNCLKGLLTESDFLGQEIEVPHALASIKQLFGQSFYFKKVEEIYEKSKKKKVQEVMTKNLKTIAPDQSLNQLANMMMKTQLKRIPVVENGVIVGIITRKDLIRVFSS